MGFHRRLFDVQVYPESFPMETLEEILGRQAIVNFAYITHDSCTGKDGVLLKAHVHIALKTNNTRNSEDVAKWFGIPPHQVEKVKGRWSDILRYLTHENAPTKYQYTRDKVVSNFDWEKEADKKSSQEEVDSLLEKICKGEIKEYDFHNHVDGLTYVKHRLKIKAAFEYRKESIRSQEKEMESIYITGDSGVGKTTLAKLWAARLGLDFFVSSGSNDILDGYKGQDCIILDDLRPSSLGLSDLLKLLDPNTASSVKSRYSNKVLECKLIIITTTKSIDNFFSEVFENEKETVVQLKRRCQTHFEMHLNTIVVRLWDPIKREYSEPEIMPNLIFAEMETRSLDRDNRLVAIKNILNVAGAYAGSLYDRVEVEEKKSSPQANKKPKDPPEQMDIWQLPKQGQ